MSEVPKSYSHDSARLEKFLEPWGDGVAPLKASSESGAVSLIENKPEDVPSPIVEDEVSGSECAPEAKDEDGASQNVFRPAVSENSETNWRVQTIYEHLCAAKAAEFAAQSPEHSDDNATPNDEALVAVVAQSSVPSDSNATPNNATPNDEAGEVANPVPRHWSERIPVWRSIKAIQRQVTALEAKCEARVTELDAKYEARVTELDAKYEALVTELDAKYEARVMGLDAKYEAQILALEAKYEAQVQLNQALDNRLTELSRYLGYEHAQDPAFDQWYQSLQDLHRGSSEDLALLQSSYLPYFEVRAPVLQPAGPVLDLGCGRGEWLSMMAEQGWQVRGVDSSELAVKAARERGLEVFKDDLLTALESQPANSLAAVTAFQVVEHLPFECVVALVKAAFRALLPGGILLFETPNPENLQVATYSFWMDPTHKKPIPPPLLMDLSFHAGFRDGLVIRQNPWPNWQGEEAEPTLEGQMNQRFYGPQDYALLAYKPATSS